jgi:hypothetical protein
MPVHLTVSDEDGNGVRGIICLDRETQICNVLFADIEHINALVDIAKAHKVPVVRVIVSPDAVDDLIALGWRLRKDLVVMTKGD